MHVYIVVSVNDDQWQYLYYIRRFTNMYINRIIYVIARIARKDITVLSTTSAGKDHPVHLAYPEGAYLTAMLVCVN